VAEIPDLCVLGAPLDRPLGRLRETGADPQERRLPGAVRSRDDEKAAARKREIDAPQDAFLPVALAEPSGREHATSIGRSARFTAVLRAPCPQPCIAQA